jgi:hypothetical protein
VRDKSVLVEHDLWEGKPQSLKALRGFLGLTGYYRKFVKHYGIIARSLTQLLKKDAFGWNEEAEDSFLRLKKAMTEAPVLALPDFSQQFIIECDASGLGIGAVLMQSHRPIAYFSQALHGRNLALSTYDKEMLALVTTVQKWRHTSWATGLLCGLITAASSSYGTKP